MKYGNRSAPADGIYGIKANSSEEVGESSASVKGGGTSLTLPVPAGSNFVFYAEPSVIVQLRNSDGACWTSEFLHDELHKNGGGKVRGESEGTAAQ